MKKEILKWRLEKSVKKLEDLREDLKKEQDYFLSRVKCEFLKYDDETNMINDLIRIIKIKDKIKEAQAEVSVLEDVFEEM